MAWLGESHGVFKLHDSDAFCGSFIRLPEIAEILGVDISALNMLVPVNWNDEYYCSELDVHRALGKGLLTSPYYPAGAQLSFDEIVLRKLFELVFEDAIIRQQIPFGRYRVDLSVTVSGRTVYVEFVGPSHFIPQYQRDLRSPLDRQKMVEDHFGAECVIWPYWIQRCSRNIRAIFDPSVDGLASVWSTKAHFGDFIHVQSADIIVNLTERFHALDSHGIGYMYMSDKTVKPIHPIVGQIMSGRESAQRLIPRGNALAGSFWLPTFLSL